MNSPSKPKSLQEKIKRTRQSNFVGREDQLNQFQQNLALSPEDDRRRCIFNVWGPGGVGKSTLLKQFRKIAEESNIVTAYIDEAEKTVPEVMGHLAADLEKQGYKLPLFTERYHIFLQKCQELETDPGAPQGFSAFLGKTAIKTGVKLDRRIPVGSASAVLDFVDEDALANQAGEWAAYVAKKINNKEEIQLIQEPLNILTPLFIQDIVKLSEKISVALFFDSYERTSKFLDHWLRDNLEGRYGALPLNILIVIAGRDELDKNCWAAYDGVLAQFHLEAFTETETKQYLNRRGINHKNLVEIILQLSGGLPLFVAILADTNPTDSHQIIELSSNAVEHFLKWIDDPKRRQLALDAAISRYLNRDVIAKLQTEEEAGELFNWLKTTSLIKKRTDGWTYQDVVRDQMLTNKRLIYSQSWAELHGKLAVYYSYLRNKLQLTEENRYSNTHWQNYTLNFLYHRLCQAPEQNLTLALNEFLAALKNQISFAQSVAEIMSQAGKDVDLAEVKNWGEKLVNGLIAYEEYRYETAIEIFTKLLINRNIDVKWRAVALNWRGYIYYLSHEYSKALDDLTEAIYLAPDEAQYLTDRGATYRVMKKYPEALQDLNQAIELNPQSDWALTNRGATYRLMERYPKALQDFNQALKLNPQSDWALASRGRTYLKMKRYPEALQDFDQAIELNPQSYFALANRGLTYRLMRQYPEALQDLNQAIKLNPQSDWAIANRGVIYRLIEQYPAALQDLNQAIRLNPQSDWAIASRGETYRLMGKYPQALQDFNQAIKLNPQYTWAIVNRGITYRLMEKYPEALQDFDQAIELNPQYDSALANRGATYALMAKYPEALQDFNQAIEINPKSDWALVSRGRTYHEMKKYAEALQDFNQAIEINPKSDWAIANRGLTYIFLEKYAEALQDFNQAIELKFKSDWVLANRGEIYRLIGRYSEAILDFDQAITINPQYTWALAHRGETYRLMEKYTEALQDFDQAVEINPQYTWALGNRGIIYLLMKQYERALIDFNQVIELNAHDDWYFYYRALAYQALNQSDAAQNDLTLAVKIAKQSFEKDLTKSWDTFNLAIYYLAARYYQQAEKLYKYALANHPTLEKIKAAIRDLKDFLTIFPDNLQALAMQKLLKSYLS